MKNIDRFRIFAVFFLSAALITPCHAQHITVAFQQWFEALDIQPGVTKELQRFQYQNGDLSADYLEWLPIQMKTLIVSTVREQLQAFEKNRCKPSIEVSYMKPGFAVSGLNIALEKTDTRFDEGVIRVEVAACLPDVQTSAAEALHLYTSPDFRKDVSSTLKNIDENSGQSCVETKGIPALLKPTLYCNHIEEFHQEGIASQHSQSIENPDPSHYQPIYFKESVKTFIELSEGLAFHYINYSRSNRLGSIKRSLGKNSIIHSQKSAIEELRKRLKKR